MLRPLAVAAVLAALAAPIALAPRPAACAPAPDVDALLSRLEASSRELTALSGEFVQRNRLKLFKKELTSRGLLRFRPPRFVHWEYVDPDPSTMVLDGMRATLTMPGQAPQVFDLSKDATMRAVFDQLLTWFAPSGLSAARKEYKLSTSGTVDAPVLGLVPLDSSPTARAFSRIELRLDGKTLLLRSILLVEKNGDEKEITFSRLERNRPLPGSAR